MGNGSQQRHRRQGQDRRDRMRLRALKRGVSKRENYVKINAGRLYRKQSVGKMGGEKDALGCWDNDRKRKQKRTVIRRGKNCSSVHPEMYNKHTQTGPK